PKGNFTFYLDIRTRLLAGNTVKNFPGLGDLLDFNNDYLDMSIHFPKNKSWLVHSMIDRAYMEWYKGDWEIRLGRQRINWGINTIWNPNDLFNAYSYFDFDYVERPGSDALRLTWYTCTNSSVEFASNFRDNFDELTFATLYKSSLGSYDVQLLGAKAGNDIVLGTGWAGNLGNAGFKGEFSYFIPTKDNGPKDALLATIAFDYAFKNSLYLNLSVLFNSDGSSDSQNNPLLLATSGLLTARYLSPYEWSTFVSGSFQFHPLFRGGLAFIYFPGISNALFINPSFDYSLYEDVDISLISQLFYDKVSNDYQALARLVYIRVKWSF
ncbi:MAG: hypothetical protein KJO29_02060, partial [Bacteroidia bacterium]|nr:hypothetical protein [Bacteroidia bacterium]